MGGLLWISFAHLSGEEEEQVKQSERNQEKRIRNRLRRILDAMISGCHITLQAAKKQRIYRGDDDAMEMVGHKLDIDGMESFI